MIPVTSPANSFFFLHLPASNRAVLPPSRPMAYSCGRRSCHLPLVKSGTSTTAQPLAIDISDNAVTAIQLAASYTSTGMGLFSLRQEKKV